MACIAYPTCATSPAYHHEGGIGVARSHLALTISLPHYPLPFSILLTFSMALPLLPQSAPKSRPKQSLWYELREVELPTVPMANKQSLEHWRVKSFANSCVCLSENSRISNMEKDDSDHVGREKNSHPQSLFWLSI